MITLDAVKLRIKRKKIKELAGECFVSSCEIKQKIPLLRVYSDEQFLTNRNGQSFLFVMCTSVSAVRWKY